MESAFSFLWALIFLYSVIAAMLLKTGKAKPCRQVGYSVYGHLVMAAGALINGLGLNPAIGVIVIMFGVYLHYKEMNEQQ
ncbi:hypothetical protein RGQ13_10915 [Thalassotalea psychrophila]|uniref:Uncharacterized protein n=1 Tax=Thalassotalea psychrophila TaxID=3065647 RepID=A0ABY9TSB8_9GAMM|nr:hypothetical protein RGQ13_10915 [Colwelliaceae bacterium SQ149]